MKKLLIFLGLLLFPLALTACDEDESSTPGNGSEETSPEIWGDWTVYAAPTCAVAGVETRESDQGNTETRPIEALGFDFGPWYTVITPNHDDQGVERRVCSRCNHYELRLIDQLPTVVGIIDNQQILGIVYEGWVTHTCVYLYFSTSFNIDFNQLPINIIESINVTVYSNEEVVAGRSTVTGTALYYYLRGAGVPSDFFDLTRNITVPVANPENRSWLPWTHSDWNELNDGTVYQITVEVITVNNETRTIYTLNEEINIQAVHTVANNQLSVGVEGWVTNEEISWMATNITVDFDQLPINTILSIVVTAYSDADTIMGRNTISGRRLYYVVDSSAHFQGRNGFSVPIADPLSTPSQSWAHSHWNESNVVGVTTVYKMTVQVSTMVNGVPHIITATNVFTV